MGKVTSSQTQSVSVLMIGLFMFAGSNTLSPGAISVGSSIPATRTYGNVIRFLPPLAISDELVLEGLDVVAAALSAA